MEKKSLVKFTTNLLIFTYVFADFMVVHINYKVDGF